MPTSPRLTGPVRPRSPRRRPLSRAAVSSGAEHAGGVGDPGGPQQVGGLGDEGDQVVGAGDQGRVVEPPVVLGDEERLPAHLQDQRLGDRPVLGAAGHAERGADQPVGVLGGAGEGHGRVQRQRQDAGPLGGGEHGEAVRAGGVEGQLAGPPGAGLGQAGDQAGQGVVGNGEDDQVGGGDDLVGGQQRDAGQQAGGAFGGGGGETRGGDDVVAGGGERGAEDGADTAGADDAHAEAGGRGGGGGQSGSAKGPAGSRHRCTSRSSPSRVPDVGRGLHRRRPQGSCWWCGGAVLRWRRPAATGCVAQVDRRWRVCDRCRPPATSGGLWHASPGAPTPGTGHVGAPLPWAATHPSRTGAQRGHDGRTDRPGDRRQPGHRAGDRAEPGRPRGPRGRDRPQARGARRGGRVAGRAGGRRRGPGPRRRRRAPRGGGPDGGRDVRQPGHAGRQRRREPRLRADGRPGPRRLPQDPRHQRRLLPRPGAGGVAGLDGRARRLGAVRRVGGRPAVVGEHRRLRRQQGRRHQPDHPARGGARPDGAGQRGRARPWSRPASPSALYEGREAEVAAEYPAGRLGVPEDVGEAAAYLLGDGAGWVTGQTLVLDGGRLSRGR